MQNNNSKALLMSPSGYIKELACEFVNSRISLVMVFPVLVQASLVAQIVMNLPAVQKTWIQSLGCEDPWRKAWQPIPVFLPRESPWTEETGRPHSIGLQRAGQD